MLCAPETDQCFNIKKGPPDCLADLFDFQMAALVTDVRYMPEFLGQRQF